MLEKCIFTWKWFSWAFRSWSSPWPCEAAFSLWLPEFVFVLFVFSYIGCVTSSKSQPLFWELLCPLVVTVKDLPFTLKNKEHVQKIQNRDGNNWLDSLGIYLWDFVGFLELDNEQVGQLLDDVNHEKSAQHQNLSDGHSFKIFWNCK